MADKAFGLPPLNPWDAIFREGENTVQAQRGLKRLTPTSNFFHTPNTPADPWDCNRYPNSPYCDSNPLRKTPLDYEIQFVKDECNIGIAITPVLGFIALPTQQIVWRKSECIRPPTKIYREDEPLHVPPPKGSGIYVFLSTGRYYLKTHDRSPNAQPIELEIVWSYSEPDGIYPRGNRYPNNIRGDFWAENVGFHKYTENGETTYFNRDGRYQSIVEDILLNFTIPIETREQSTTRIFLTENFGAMFDMVVAVLFFRYEDALKAVQGNTIFRNRSASTFRDREIGLIDGREDNFRIQWDVYELGVDGFSVPPPPKKPKRKDCCDMACCSQNEQLLRLILKRIGPVPAVVPASLVRANSGTRVINSLAEYIAYSVIQTNAQIGQFPQEINIQDADLTQEGDQSKKVSLPNLAESIAEIVGMLLVLQSESNANLIATINAMVEAGNAKQLALLASDYAAANAEFLGYKGKQIERKIPFTFKPGEQQLDKMLKAGEVKVKGWDNDDKNDLNDVIMPLLEMAAMFRAQNFRNVGTGNTIDKLKGILKGAVTLSDAADLLSKFIPPPDPEDPNPQVPEPKVDEWDAFINQVETGFIGQPGVSDPLNPYGRPLEQRPRIRDIGQDTSEDND